LGYAAVALDFAIPWREAAVAGLGVALVGVANLGVSFALALYVALKARQVSFAQGRRLAGNLVARFWHAPGEFLMPPRATDAEESRDAAAD
ncbi:MAG TPA: preprotein translocase subunit TatB, partial [Azospira sp.]|nr:preprotein translocase subunit TatB [Azospira sp.]